MSISTVDLAGGIFAAMSIYGLYSIWTARTVVYGFRRPGSVPGSLDGAWVGGYRNYKLFSSTFQNKTIIADKPSCMADIYREKEYLKRQGWLPMNLEDLRMTMVNL